MEHFNIRRLPVIVALTADVSYLDADKFDSIIHDLGPENVEYLLKTALLKEKDIAWKSYIKVMSNSNKNMIESSNPSEINYSVSVDSSRKSNFAFIPKQKLSSS